MSRQPELPDRTRLRPAALRAAIGVISVALAAAGLVTTASDAAAAPIKECNVAIPMSDGVLLRANLEIPAAKGRYPLALTITPYSKDSNQNAVLGAATGIQQGGAVGAGSVCRTPGTADEAGLINDGYALMELDSRGTGMSEGEFDVGGPRSRQDYAEVFDWVQRQPWSNGRIGVNGCSGPGAMTNSAAVADASRVKQGKPRAVYTVIADSGFPDSYRDLFGGPGGTGAGSVYLLASGISIEDTASAGLNYPGDPATYRTLVEHLPEGGYRDLALDGQTDGPLAYNGPWYDERAPITHAADITIPIVETAELQDFDSVQRGAAAEWDALVHAQKRVLIMAPGYHCNVASPAYPKLGFGDRTSFVHKWFDRWVKGIHNGIDRIPNVNLLPVGGTRWVQSSTFPLARTSYQRLYLDGATSGTATSLNDGTLSLTPPTRPGRDSVIYQPLSGACTGESAANGSGITGAPNPCANDNRVNEATNLTYTTAPLPRTRVLGGPITADLWAGFNRRDGVITATLSIVNADGSSSQLSWGSLRASLRACDRKRTLFGPGGVVLRPWHPLTKASQRMVDIGVPDRYLIEMLPMAAVVPAGARLRLTISTQTFPTKAPSVQRTADMAGGTMVVSHSRQLASHIVIPWAS